MEMAIRSLKEESNSDSRALNEFFTLMAVCHTVVPDVDKETGVVNKYQVKYTK